MATYKTYRGVLWNVKGENLGNIIRKDNDTHFDGFTSGEELISSTLENNFIKLDEGGVFRAGTLINNNIIARVEIEHIS